MLFVIAKQSESLLLRASTIYQSMRPQSAHSSEEMVNFEFVISLDGYPYRVHINSTPPSSTQET